MSAILENHTHVEDRDASVPTKWTQLGFWKWLLVMSAFLLMFLLIRQLDIQNQLASETCHTLLA